MKNPKLSIIIPVYNTEKYLAACLDSVVGQSWKNLEVLIVDDCTPDRAMKIAQDYAERYPFIRILHHSENHGLFRARITGMQAMTGDYFAFLDSDDTVTLDYYRPMLKKAMATGADLVAGDFIEVMKSGDLYYPNRIYQQVNLDLKGQAILNFLLGQAGQDYGCHIIGNKVYNYSLYVKIAPFLQSVDSHFIMCEDVLYAILLFGSATAMQNVHGEYYCYFRHEGASTSTKKLSVEKCEKAIQDITTVFNYATTYLKAINAGEKCFDGLAEWQHRLAQGWKNTVSCQLKCSSLKKQALYNSLEKLLSSEQKNENRTTPEIPFTPILMKGLPLQEIKQAIQKSDCEYVSFDVFDTLLLRPFWYPTDMFTFMEPDVTKILGSVDSVRFEGLRKEAEYAARQYAINNNQKSIGEVTLDEIYQAMARMCPKLEPYIEQIKQLEIDCELRFCSARKTAKELLEFAQDMGKKVICVSDMYLSSNVIGQMLANSGYTGIERIFVSGETGSNKQTGSLYRYVEQELGCKAAAFVHIGDNLESDVKKAKGAGWKAFYLPKVTACMMNQVPGYQYGSLFNQLYRNNSGIRLESFGFEYFFGMRCRLAVAANRLYDNPFIPVEPSGNFNADPVRIGYFAVGPYLLAIAQWLAELCRDESFDRMNFVARDGWLPMRAFEAVKSVYGLENLPSDYIYVSRKTVMPLLLNTPECLTTVPWSSYNMHVLSPKKFVDLVQQACTSEGIRQLQEALEQQKLSWTEPFGNNANFEKFLNLFMWNAYDKEQVQHYSQLVKNYYAPLFQGKTASFDIGYSCRSEVVFKQLFHFDVTPCYLHINGEIADLRSYESDLKRYTFYDYNPGVTGALREQIISYQGPSCTGFDCRGDQAVPLFEDYTEPFSAWYVTTHLQKAALQYVKDMVAVFGHDLKRVYARKMDASWPMEYFMHYPRPMDADLFNAIPFEDDMGIGRVTIRDFWRESLNAVHPQKSQGNGWDDRLDYYAMKKPKKWLVWLLVDRKILKDTAKRKLQNHPVWRAIGAKGYHALRRVGRFFFR